MSMTNFKRLAIIGAVLIFSGGLAQAETKWRKPTTEELKLLNLPLGLNEDAARVPENNPITADKIALGRSLYFDTRISRNNTISCATCHNPKLGFTDAQPVSLGIGTIKGGRSAPTVINRLFSKVQFWDGRAPSLEEQAKGPITDVIEMGMPSHDVVIKKLNRIKGYKKWFKKVFGFPVTLDGIAKAIATFERTVVSGNSPFDRHENGVAGAMTEAQVRGLNIFKEKARCDQCHVGPNFSDEKFHNVGIGWDSHKVDLGLFDITKKAEDMGKFKTPTLREVANTGPYMHNGQFATLRQVLEFYNKGGNANPFLDHKMRELDLTEEEKSDLVAFLLALNGEGWQDKTSPASFPN